MKNPIMDACDIEALLRSEVNRRAVENMAAEVLEVSALMKCVREGKFSWWPRDAGWKAASDDYVRGTFRRDDSWNYETRARDAARKAGI